MTDIENLMHGIAGNSAEIEIESKVETVEQTGEYPVELLKTMAL